MNRRDFFRSAGVLTLLSVELNGGYIIDFNKNDSFYLNLELLFSDLLADDMPSVKELNTIAYIATVLNSTKVKQNEKDFYKNGIKWLNEDSKELYNKLYSNLDSTQRQNVLKHINAFSWGDSFLYNSFIYYFESMFSDPIYGVNIDESGWKYLNYIPGYPRPSKVGENV